MHTVAFVIVLAVLLLGGGGLVAAGLLGRTAVRGRVAAYGGLGAVGVAVGYLGVLFQPYEARFGSSAGSAGTSGGAVSGVPNAAEPAVRAGSSSGGGVALVVPTGAIIGLVLLLALLCGGLAMLRTPVGVVAPAAGWVALIVLVMARTSKGDVLLEQTGPALFFVFGGLILSAVVWGMAQYVVIKDQIGAVKRT